MYKNIDLEFDAMSADVTVTTLIKLHNTFILWTLSAKVCNDSSLKKVYLNPLGSLTELQYLQRYINAKIKIIEQANLDRIYEIYERLFCRYMVHDSDGSLTLSANFNCLPRTANNIPKTWWTWSVINLSSIVNKVVRSIIYIESNLPAINSKWYRQLHPSAFLDHHLWFLMASQFYRFIWGDGKWGDFTKSAKTVLFTMLKLLSIKYHS